MKTIQIIRWDNKKVIHEGNFGSIKECLEDGIKKWNAQKTVKILECTENGKNPKGSKKWFRI